MDYCIKCGGEVPSHTVCPCEAIPNQRLIANDDPPWESNEEIVKNAEVVKTLEREIAELRDRQRQIVEILDAYHRYAACVSSIVYNHDALALRDAADLLFDSLQDEMKLDKKRPGGQGGEGEGVDS